MRKTLLSLCALGVVLGAGAQSVSHQFPSNTDVKAQRSLSDIVTGNETGTTGQQHQVQTTNPYEGMYSAAKAAINPPFAQAVTETQIGQTTYDLQSNSAVQNRIEWHGNGTMSAVWTYSMSGDIAASDRGTGYNYFDGTTWGSMPTQRIEPDRNGWPTVGATASGKEIVTLHNTAQSTGTINSRSTVGTGTWTTANYTTNYQIWNRMTIGGATGNSLHMISLRDPSAAVNGVAGHMFYYRSQDGGVTWDISDGVIPGMDNTRFAAMSGDSYSFANARGDTIAFAYWGQLNDVIVGKSYDNGTTWNLTTVIDVFPNGEIFDSNSNNTSGSPIGISDVNGDQVADTVNSSDGTGAIMLDRNGMVHLVYGAMRYLDDTPGDGSWSFFPGTNGIYYWNENMGTGNPGVMITGALDLNSNGGIDIVGGDPNAGIGTYYTSLSSFESLSQGGGDTIYLAYSAINELLDNTAQTYRHEYVMMSTDNGCTWQTPVDVTGDPSHDFDECVFGALSRYTTDGRIHMVYQFDNEPGLAVRGDNDAFGTNQINYLEAPASDFATGVFSCVSFASADFYNICNGDTAVLSASCGSAYNWSTGGTTQSIIVTAPGTYTVTITNQCGTAVESVTVGSGTAPVANVTASSNAICPGDSAILTADPVAGGTFAWSTGGTTQSIAVTSAGTYTVTVTNCVGTDTASVTITSESLPTLDSLTTAGGMQTFCEGDGPVTLTVSGASGNVIAYQWYQDGTPVAAPAGTSSFLSVNNASDAGTYTCTVYNQCGDSAVSAGLTMTINPLPATPSCTYDVGTETWSTTATGVTYQWYQGVAPSGTPISGETGSSFNPGTWQSYNGTNVYVMITDPNGCTNYCSGQVGFEELSMQVALDVYPNPNNGQFSVDFIGARADVYRIEVKNVLGQVIKSESLKVAGNYNMPVNLSKVDKGVYFVTISNSLGDYTERVVIR